MLRIIGKASSINVRKVLWTCAETGRSYEREEWQDSFARLNPNAMAPVIVDDGFVLWESNTICRYLCAQGQGSVLLGTDARQRARVEQWMDWQATELNNAWRYAFMALVRNSPAHTDATQVAASVGNWNRHVGMLEAQLCSTGQFVTGEHFTLADVVLGLSVNRWLMTPMERPDYPALRSWFERLGERPGFLEHGRNGTP
ncbi:MAG: glutathione S-transferase family protein [Massilia sp.]